MWVIEGPFDGPDKQRTEDKRKLLRPGRTYALGRRNKDLNITLTCISKDHGTFQVGTFTAEEAENENFVPKLTYIQWKRELGLLRAGGDGHSLVNAGTEIELGSGDAIHPAGGAMGVRVEWIAINILSTHSKLNSSSRAELKSNCLDLGIRLVKSWSKAVTHVMTPAISPPYDWSIVTALVTASQLVTPAWALEIVRRSKLDRGLGGNAPDVNLEDTFDWIKEKDYRPPGATLGAWDPDRERRALLKGLRFIALGQDLAPQALRDLIDLGEGSYESLILPDDCKTHSDWKLKLSGKRSKAGSKKQGMGSSLVLIGDAEALEAGLGSSWKDIYGFGMRSLGMRMVGRQELTDALFRKDLSLIDCLVGSARSQEVADEPILDKRSLRARTREPSVPPSSASTARREVISTDQTSAADVLPNGTSNRSSASVLPRRASRTTPATSTSRPPGTQDASGDVDTQPGSATAALPPTRNPLLKRRTAASPAATPLEAPALAQPKLPPAVSAQLPPRRALLKRRAVDVPSTGETNVAMKESDSQVMSQAEPPHKRFKALFEGTPQMNSVPEEESGQLNSEPTSQIQKRKRSTSMDLDSNEESLQRQSKKQSTAMEPPEQSHSLGHVVTQTTGAGSQSQHLNGPSQPRSESGPLYKPSQSVLSQSQILGKSKVKAEPPSPIKRATGGGAVVDSRKEPDQEPQFLQALNSRTKGKRKEDDFDRQFNQLRIAAPQTKAEQEEKLRAEHEMAVWNDFEKDPHVRGNFMIVEYVDLLRKDGGRRKRSTVVDENLAGVPNFKKFKKKNASLSRAAIVDVELSASVDYGMGDGYWQNDPGNVTLGGDELKPGVGSTQSQLPFGILSRSNKAKAKAPPRRRLAAMVDSDEDSDDPLPTKPKGKGKGRAGSESASTKASKSKKTFADRIPDFDALSEEIEDEEPMGMDIDDEGNEAYDMSTPLDDDLPPDASNSTLKSSATQSRTSKRLKPPTTHATTEPASQSRSRSTRSASVDPAAITQKSGKAPAPKRKAPVVIAVDSDDSDAGLFKARKRLRPQRRR